MINLNKKTSDGRLHGQIVLSQIYNLYKKQVNKAKIRLEKGQDTKEFRELDRKRLTILEERKKLATLYAKKQIEYSKRLSEVSEKREKLYGDIKHCYNESYETFLTTRVGEKSIFQVENVMNTVNVLQEPKNVNQLIQLTLKELKKNDNRI